MTGRGFKQVYNLKGGIAAWQGHAAAGPSEMGMVLLKGHETPREVICLAYGLEEGLRKFYSMAIKLAIDSEEEKAHLKSLGDLLDKNTDIK